MNAARMTIDLSVPQRIHRRTLGMLLLAGTVLALAGCGWEPPSEPILSSQAVTYSVSLEGGPSVQAGLAWTCASSWQSYFSERDMAMHRELQTEAGALPTTFLELADGIVVGLRPGNWPACPAKTDWKALVFDPRGKIPTLTLVDGSTDDKGMLAVLPGLKLNIQARKGQGPEAQPAPAVLDGLYRHASSLQYRVLDFSGDVGFVLHGSFFKEIRQTLLALPRNAPTVLPAIQATGHPLQGLLEQSAEDGVQGVARLHPAFEVIGDDRARNVPLTAKGFAIDLSATESSPHLLRFVPGDMAPPVVRVPRVKRAVRVDPVAAVWYPDRRHLLLLVWGDESKHFLDSPWKGGTQ